MDSRQQTLMWPPWVAQTTGVAQASNIHMASRDSVNHRDLLRKSNPENELFFIPDILSLLRARAILRLPSVFWGLSLRKFQAVAHHHEPFSATTQSPVH